MSNKLNHVLGACRISGMPILIYLCILIISFIAIQLEVIPDNILGSMLMLMVLGEGLNKIGASIPVVRTYLGGSVVCIFAGAILAWIKVIPESAMNQMDTFVNEQGFLIFYISALITGSLFGIDRDLLLKGSVRLLPVGILAVLCGTFVCGIVGILTGDGFWDNILYIAAPMTSGGMTAGTVPLSHTYSEVLDLDAGDVLTRMAPATVLGNCFAVIFAGLLNNFGQRYPQITGNGQLMNDGRAVHKYNTGTPSLESMMTGLLISMGFYTLGSVCRFFLPSVPVYAWMILIIVVVKSLRILPQDMENAACHWGNFVIKAWTAAALFGIGITLIDLNTIMHNMTIDYFLTVLIVEIVITAISAAMGKLVGFYPLESAVCGMCSTNMGGSGNVAVLSGAHRMELLPFAQIITRGCGAMMLTAAGLLVQVVGR